LAYTTKYGNYVKFLRGTPAAWQSIESKDSDTLYFISEPGSEKGKLYLGSKLIADGDSATHIKDLEGVLISEGIPTNSLLVYNGATGNWENKTLQEVFAIIVDVMIGATADSNGQSGLVPVPLAGQQDMYLQGDGTWSNPTEDVEKELDNLTDTVAKNAQAWKDELALLRGGKTGTIVDIATDIVDEAVAKIVSDAPESFDTLKEIADWINEHDSAINIADIVVKVNKHEEVLYDAADGTPGLITQVGNLDDAINNSSTGLIVKMNTLTGSLNKAIADIADLDQGLNDLGIDVETLKALLKWQDMVEEETV
jgi:hypothetical protein